jgi:hypothetical protein
MLRTSVSILPSRFVAMLSLALLASCAGATAAPSPTPAPGTSTTSPGAQPPLTQAAWPVRSREHLDLWLHGYALISQDTTLVPYFRRGYKERISAVRSQRNVSTQLDANRSQLVARLNVQPSLATSGQFLPLYFSSWEQMRQMIDLFVRNNGNPGNTNDPAIASYFGVLGSVFSTVADRDWLRLFVASLDDESAKFYHGYWTSEYGARSAVIARVDSLWQRNWRPALQRFLNNTQQQNGELYLSFPLGGEGRTVQFGKLQNAVAGPMPETMNEVESVLYVMVHEISGAVANTAIADNTTPADRRAGVTSRYEQSAAVRAGAVLLEKTIPSAVPGYMRFYLQTAGRTPPTDPRALFTSTFAIPDAVRDALTRQFDVILGGI